MHITWDEEAWIDSRHRLIYQISDDGKALWIISCRFHYGQ